MNLITKKSPETVLFSELRFGSVMNTICANDET
jgi:hypothetical protein